MTSFKAGGGSIQSSDEFRKTYTKHFGQAQQLIAKDDPQGYEAVKLLINHHFTLFFQNEEILTEIMLNIYPSQGLC